jgi:hypothetical protein
MRDEPIHSPGRSVRDVRFLVVAGLAGMAHLGTPLAQTPVPSSFSFEVVPGERFGPIREDTSRQALASLVSPGALVDGEVSIGEGFCTGGARVFPGGADEIEVVWQDASRARVAFVRARAPGGRWRTPRGVRVGTLLTDLERLAGGVITFSGFGWDYGGGTSWREAAGEIGLRLDIHPLDAPKAAGPEANGIFGDRPVRSDHPVIRALRVRVEEMVHSWGPHDEERECRGR